MQVACLSCVMNVSHVHERLKWNVSFGYFQVFMWEAPAEVATVEELDQFYILCPVNVKDSYLVETVRMFQEKNEKGSIMIFTDTCK